MSELLVLVLIVVFWVVLSQVILPRLGIPT